MNEQNNIKMNDKALRKSLSNIVDESVKAYLHNPELIKSLNNRVSIDLKVYGPNNLK